MGGSIFFALRGLSGFVETSLAARPARQAQSSSSERSRTAPLSADITSFA